MDDDQIKKEILRTAQAFEHYVRFIWPWHRRLVSHKIKQRCHKCAASEAMIPIKASGLCDICSTNTKAYTQHSKPPVTDSESGMAIELAKILEKYAGAGTGAFDVLMPFSGGKDSIYMARRIQLEHPNIRILAYTIDNGFMSPIAKENITSSLERLSLDHIFVRPKKKFFVRLFSYALQHLNHKGGYGTVDFSDGEFMLDTARRLAADMGIPLILCGYSRYQVQDGIGLHHFESPPEIESKARTHTAGLCLEDIFPDKQDRSVWWNGGQGQKIARLLFPLYAWNLEEDVIRQQVQSWGLANKKYSSPIVTNHQLIPLIGVVDVHKFGYSSFEIEFCRMIRDGKADYKHWRYTFEFLEYTARTGMFLKPVVAQSLSALGLSLSDVGIKYRS